MPELVLYRYPKIMIPTISTVHSLFRDFLDPRSLKLGYRAVDRVPSPVTSILIHCAQQSTRTALEMIYERTHCEPVTLCLLRIRLTALGDAE